jgi:UDP-glucose 4-epimerase
MKTILITGCAGFIGSSFIKSIIQKKLRIIGIDDLSAGFKNRLPVNKNFQFIKGDCSDKKILKKIKGKVDIIIHLAGQSSGEKSFYDPINDINRNLFSTIALLKFYLKKKSKQFIYASSMSVYGDLRKQVDERCKTKPISFYGLSKLSSEKYIKMYSNKKINFTILRFFNVYGEGQTLNNLKQGMIRIFLTQIFNSNQLIVKGSLKRFRDFIHILDVNKILQKIVGNRNCFNKTFNVGYGKKYVIKDVVKLIKKKSKKKFSIKVKANTPFDQFGIYSNSNKLFKTIKFKAKIALENGLDKYISSIMR